MAIVLLTESKVSDSIHTDTSKHSQNLGKIFVNELQNV